MPVGRVAPQPLRDCWARVERTNPSIAFWAEDDERSGRGRCELSARLPSLALDLDHLTSRMDHLGFDDQRPGADHTDESLGDLDRGDVDRRVDDRVDRASHHRIEHDEDQAAVHAADLRIVPLGDLHPPDRLSRLEHLCVEAEKLVDGSGPGLW